jgi:hypothetical protein
MLIAVFYGPETWFLAVRVKYRSTVFGNRMLRKILGPKRKEVTEEWRKLNNEELCTLHDLS